MTTETDLAIPPGETIAEELEARCMSRRELALKIGRSVRVVHDLVNARRSIDPELALDLEAALGPSARFWLNLESDYQLTLARQRRSARSA